MKLAEWMALQGLDDDKLAEMTGFDRVTISRNRRGITKPSELLLERFREVSQGAVTANDFFHIEAAQ